MKRVLLLCAVALFVLAAAPVSAGDDVTMEGSFVWQRSDGEKTGDLKAVFTPTAKGQWDVAFHFDWEDGAHVYKGSARGSLKKGSLEGQVDNDSEEHPATFKFRGSFTDGTLSAKHTHVGDEGEKETGTFELRAAK